MFAGTILRLALGICAAGVVDGFSTAPDDAETKSASYLGRSFCQDAFLSGARNFNPLNGIGETPTTNLCSDIEFGFRSVDVRLFFHNKEAKPRWCNTGANADTGGARVNNPFACAKAYAHMKNGWSAPCRYDSQAKKCLLSENSMEHAKCSLYPAPVCEFVRGLVQAAELEGADVPSACSAITQERECNTAVIPQPNAGMVDDTPLDIFSTCIYSRGECKEHVDVRCPKQPEDRERYRRKLLAEQDRQREENRRRQSLPDSPCSILNDPTRCEQGYTYDTHQPFAVSAYNKDTNLPPKLAMCKWDKETGACIESDVTCPYTCEQIYERARDLPGRVLTDKSYTFGDRVLESDTECTGGLRDESSDICYERYLAAPIAGKSASDEYMYELTPCRYSLAVWPRQCVPDHRVGFEPCE